MKKFFIFTLLLMSIFIFAQTKLVIWCSEKQVDILQKLAEEFKAKYNVDVEVQYVNFSDIKPKFLTAAPEGQGADIIVGAHDWVGELVVNGLIEPIPVFSDLNQFYETGLNAFSYGGKLYGLPYSMEAIALIYNKDFVPQPPQTVEEMIQFAKQIDTEFGGEVRGFVTSTTEFYYAVPFIFGYGGYVFKQTDQGLNIKDIGLANEGAVTGVTLIKRFVDEGILDPSDNYQIMDSMFREGKAAMIINGPWATKAYKDAGIDYGVAVIPNVGPDMVARPFVGVQGFMVNAKSTNKLLAMEFLTNFIAKRDTMYKLYLGDPRLPARKDVLELVKDNPDVVAFTQSAANGIPMPNVPQMASVWGAMNDALNLVVNNKASVEDALKTAVERIKSQTQ
ncbi:MAG: maltose/maltodextrin transport system substrate-binding protein [Pseudothermotoga sp.]|jgi:maltose/maltodextrin transport system substrate-binding protein|uniref:maltose/maltodextrin ABC transporter substrate-binding protein MalE n=1 Tax=Pseudothermotoga sp. TaxID=2033661 RepID=UPI0024AAB8AB|nr:maltose/maltodextrin ABC transporter substrate-binding protein MalE [Pseudothermotoga sp.]MDI3495544.1 maltose/maltodextrin transport system substrate-binding protein [Pseudothermotoga sp.]MDK2883875.1 maltose/maltodextrin transport system substrate-binding protein [Pseudothermotoga sp.]